MSTVFPQLERARSISFKLVAGRRCIRGRVLFEGAVYLTIRLPFLKKFLRRVNEHA